MAIGGYTNALSLLNNSFKNYAKYYGIIYSNKDYKKECNFLEDIFARYCGCKLKSILDAGCGTGGHSIEFAKRGYEVLSVDRSRKMINIAVKKAKDGDVKVDCMRRYSEFLSSYTQLVRRR